MTELLEDGWSSLWIWGLPIFVLDWKCDLPGLFKLGGGGSLYGGKVLKGGEAGPGGSLYGGTSRTFFCDKCVLLSLLVAWVGDWAGFCIFFFIF